MVVKMKNLKISVVIPVYKSEHILVRCLEHIIHNTYQNLEIIIVDDGSPDNSEKIYSEYAKKDKRIKIIKQKNQGPACARNTGLKSASGDYIHFCDSDDFVDLDYYEKMLESANITDADIVCGNVRERGFIFPEFHDIKIATDLKDKISLFRAYDFHVVWRFIYKRKFLQENKILFPTGMFWGEDTIFMNKALYHSRTVATARDAFYNCIDNPISLGKNIKDVIAEKGNGSKKDFEKYEKFLQDSGLKQIMESLRKNGEIEKIEKLDVFKISVFCVKYFRDGGKTWVLFGIPVLKKKITTTKIRYYLCGLYLWRRYMI